VVELLVPELADEPFREHYRELILGSVLHAAEAQSVRHRERGHRLRARRFERVVALLQPAAEAPQAVPGTASPSQAPALSPPSRGPSTPWFGRRLRLAAGLVWLTTLGLLLTDIAVLGVHAWTTTLADVGLIAMSFVLFFVYVDDLLDN
jgi:hypothetical protein